MFRKFDHRESTATESVLLLGVCGDSTQSAITDAGFSLTHCQSTDHAVECLTQLEHCALLFDLDRDGETNSIRNLRTLFPELTMIAMTEPSDLASGIMAKLSGATDYIQKPFESDRLLPVIVNARRKKHFERLLAQSANEVSSAPPLYV